MEFDIRKVASKTYDVPPSRRNNINILRMFAAVLVLYGHMFPILGGSAKIVQSMSVSSYGVYILFALSGYLNAESWKRDPRALSFLGKRILHIFPGLLLLLLVTIFIIGPIVTTLTPGEYFRNPNTYLYGLNNLRMYMAFDLPGVFADNIYPNVVNGSLWSLPIEIVLYIVLSLFMMILGRMKKPAREIAIAVMAFISCALGWYAQVFDSANPRVLYGTSWLQAMCIAPYFFVGVLFTLPCMKRLLSIQWATAALFALCFFDFPYPIAVIAIFLLVPYIVFSFAFTETPVFYRFGARHELSYGVYLYSFMVQQALSHYLAGTSVSFWGYFVLSLAISLLFSLASFYIIEKPMVALSKKLFQKNAQ